MTHPGTAPLARGLGHLAQRLTHRPAGDELWPALRPLGPALQAVAPAAAQLSPPAPVLEEWRHGYRQTRAANTLLLVELARVIDALVAAGVTPIVFKGAALLAETYPDPGLRPMDDADLLVRPEQRATAVAVLAGAGYRPVEIGPGRFDLLGPEPPDAQAYRLPPARLSVELDLHWRTVADARLRAALPGVDDHGIWTRARRWRLDGAESLTPDAVDAAVAIAASQMLWHPWAHPLGYLDLHLLVDSWSEETWLELVERVRRRGLRAPLYWSLRFCQELFGTAVPSSALAALAPGATTRRAVEALVGGDWLGRSPHRREMAARDLLLVVLVGPSGVLRMLRAGVRRQQPGGRGGQRVAHAAQALWAMARTATRAIAS